MQLWLKADSLSLSNGAGVSSWLDSSSNNRAAEQTSGANQPTFVANAINGLPVVRLDGSDDEMLINASAGGSRITWSGLGIGSSGMTVIGVVDTTPFNTSYDGALLLGDENGMIGVEALQSNGFDDIRLYRHAGSTQTGPLPSGFFIPEYTGSNMAPSGSNTRTVRLDGGSIVGSTSSNSSFSIAELMSLGTDVTGNVPRHTNYFGDIAELLVYDRVLSEEELQLVGAYLEEKYALNTAYAVPEPACLGMLATAGALLLRHRRRNRE